MANTFETMLNNVRHYKPLVHHITNYVTANDCANITLCIGASPVMADEIDEAADITSISDSLVINMGTLNNRTIPSMLAAGVAANKKGIPVVLDPVGVGASAFRTSTAEKLLAAIKFSVVRGNISEIKVLAGLDAATKGVDASHLDATTTENGGQIAKNLANKLSCTVVISGAVDIISDGIRTAYVKNGHPLLASVCGSGCMCSSLVGAFAGAKNNDIFMCAVAAMACMGIAGEDAYKEVDAKNSDNGNRLASFYVALRDAISAMDGNYLERQAMWSES